MTDTINSHVSGDTTISEDREHLVMVVRFNDLANIKYGLLVEIVAVLGMQRTWLIDITI